MSQFHLLYYVIVEILKVCCYMCMVHHFTNVFMINLLHCFLVGVVFETALAIDTMQAYTPSEVTKLLHLVPHLSLKFQFLPNPEFTFDNAAYLEV